MPTDRQLAAPAAPESARHRLDRKIASIGSAQDQIVRLEQLLDAGLSPRGVRSRVAAGRLHRIHRGVFCLHPPPLERRQRFRAAVYACGPGTSLSDLSAANHLGMAESAPAVVHVSNGSGSGRTLPGIVVHRRKIARCDVLIRGGIPCTSPARTIVDCSAAVDRELLEDLLMAADSRRILNRRRLEELVRERRGQPGMRMLAMLITDDPVETRSENERRMLRICRRFDVPEPLVNHRIRVRARQFYADFCWPELSLIVEVDSWRWHGGRLAGESDADRDQILAVAGWRVVHFTRDQVKRESERTGRRLVALTRRQRKLPAIGS